MRRISVQIKKTAAPANKEKKDEKTSLKYSNSSKRRPRRKTNLDILSNGKRKFDLTQAWPNEPDTGS